MSPVRFAIRAVSLLLAVLILAMAGWRLAKARRESADIRQITSVDYGMVQPFTLTDQLGRPVSLSDLKGKVWVADFIFTRCMGPCPVITAKMGRLRKEFADRKDLVFVSFSVDPDFDTPAILRKYAEVQTSDHDGWRFLTGPRKEVVDLISRSFRLAVGDVEEEKDGIINILHSLHFVLVDDQGRIAGIFDSSDESEVERLRTELKRAG